MPTSRSTELLTAPTNLKASIVHSNTGIEANNYCRHKNNLALNNFYQQEVEANDYLQEVVNRVKLCHLQRIKIRKKERQVKTITLSLWRRGSTNCNESSLKQRLVNGKKQFLLKLSSGTVTRTQSPNQRDVPYKLLRNGPKQVRKDVVRLKTRNER